MGESAIQLASGWNTAFADATTIFNPETEFGAAVGISANGLYVGGYAIRQLDQQSVGQGWVVESLTGNVYWVVDADGEPLDATVMDISDDARLAVVQDGDPSTPAWLYVAGVPIPFPQVMSRFGFGARDVDLAESLYFDGEQYHFALQSVADATGYYLSIPASAFRFDLPGDYNGDAVVNAADYVVWRNHLDQSTFLVGDPTPGTVTQADYNVWRSNFGSSSASSSAMSRLALPENSALWLLLLGCTAQCAAPRRR
jgi:hypothetical protein